MTDYIAAFGDDERFVDLVMDDPAGLYFRDDGGWQMYQPGDVSLDGMTVVDVDEDFVKVVDKLGDKASSITPEQAERYAPGDE
jgi:hypothetical protein